MYQNKWFYKNMLERDGNMYRKNVYALRHSCM